MASLQTHQDKTIVTTLLERPALQLLAVLVGTFVSGVSHWQNDGLWFQGDAPRHAANGLFFWDLVTSLPTNPLTYALSYYARYPVITPIAYPPLFYLPEGFAFWAIGPSPFVAKGLVLAFAAVAGLYTMAWGRRWIGPIAGWAGFCTVLLPGFVLYSNAVLLNVPATALGFAGLYHFRIWIDTASSRHLKLFSTLIVAAVLTYYPAVVVVPIALPWLLRSKRPRHRVLWALLGSLIVLALLASSLLPVYLARNTVSFQRLFASARWVAKFQELSGLTGAPWIALALAGLGCGFAIRRGREEAAHLALAYLSILACLLPIRWSDPRYGLAQGPLVVLAAFLGIVRIAESSGRWRSVVSAGGLAFSVALAVYIGLGTSVPAVSGFDQIAQYLRVEAPEDSVLYSGRHDGVFGFYARASDPRFERRLVFWRKIFRTDDPDEIPDVIQVIQSQCACRWVAVEVTDRLGEPEQRLRDALAGPEFVRIRSFPVLAPSVVRVDLYRFTLPIATPPPMDLRFSDFSRRLFPGVEPIKSRN